MPSDPHSVRVAFPVFVEMPASGSFSTREELYVSREELALLKQCRRENVSIENCKELRGLCGRIENSVVHSNVLYDDIYESEIGSAAYSITIPEEVLSME